MDKEALEELKKRLEDLEAKVEEALKEEPKEKVCKPGYNTCEI